MLEIFKTNVERKQDAILLAGRIRRAVYGHSANFDLEDCDRILRVWSILGDVQSGKVIQVLTMAGFDIEILQDEQPKFMETFWGNSEICQVLDQ